MNHSTKIYFRADGSNSIGLGHVVRSLALAEILKPYFSIHFIIKLTDESVLEQVTQVCNKVTVLEKELSGQNEAEYLISKVIESNSIVVLDGYHFGTDYQKVIKSKQLKLVSIDDVFNCHFLSDVIINPGGGITENNYSTENYARFFLGPEYVLLRKPFRQNLSPQLIPKEESIFVCLGGADPNNDILNIIDKFEHLAVKQKIFIVIGSAFRYQDLLQQRLKNSNLSYEVLQQLSGTEMAFYMCQCSIAVTSPSSVSYEYLSLGGLLYLYPIADNQKHMFSYLIKEKLALDWKDFPLSNQERINEVLKKQQQVFDGKVATRLYKIFRDLNNELNTQIRPVAEKDLMLLFNWANDLSTRAQSFNKNPILIEDHSQWFLAKLKDPNCSFCLLEFKKEPVGQIRFDIKNEKAIISYSIANNYRRKGIGKILLAKGIEYFNSKYKGSIPIVGYVKKSNLASVSTFKKLNFKKQDTADYEDSYLFYLTKG